MGYYRPVSQFNRGKQSEFQEREFFVEPSGAVEADKLVTA
jgi:hypothetical protein